MKRKSFVRLMLSLFIIAVAAVYFFIAVEYGIQKNARVKCTYMMYACGDCYPRYNVKEVIPSALEKKLLREDIAIEFANKEQETVFENQTGVCSICYTYDFKGDLYYSNRMNCYVIKLGSYKLKVNFSGCCKH